MNRLLYYGCTPGDDVARLQNDLNLITGHTRQGSAMAVLQVDGIFGSKSQSRLMEFQRINGLTADGVAGQHTQGKLNELFSSEPGLQIKRIRGGIAGDSTGEGLYGKMPPAGTGAKKDGGIQGKQGGWGKSGAKDGGTKTTGIGGVQGKVISSYGHKAW